MQATDFYTEFLMSRGRFKPQDFGVDLDRSAFDTICIEAFAEAYRTWSFDELLLHPEESLQFCRDLRRKQQWWDVPNDIILRVILRNRKAG